MPSTEIGVSRNGVPRTWRREARGFVQFFVFAIVFSLGLLVPPVSSAQTAELAIVPPGAPVLPGGSAVAVFTVRGDLAVSGFSFGVSHDAAVLTGAVGGPSVGADLAATRGGAGPEFLSIDTFAIGFTFAAIVNSNSVGPELSALAVHEVATMQYTVSATATAGTSPIAFTATLGTPPVALSVGMGTAFAEQVGVDLIVTDAEFPIAIPFRRGDVNQNGAVSISDAIFQLYHLFASSPVGCSESVDTNGDGTLSIADTVYLLAYLFTSGSAPPEPFGDCVLPAAPLLLGCDSFTCP